MFRHYNMIAPTREGWAYLALLAGVMFGAVNTGNNLVYIVLGVLLGMLVVANVLAEWNLRGLSVERRFPAEVFAGIPATGSFVLKNPRGTGTAYAIELSERGSVQGATTIDICSPASTAEMPVDWVFPLRGDNTLLAIRVASSFPFGLVRRWRDLPVPATLLAYPAPSGRPPTPLSDGDGDEPTSRSRPADLGDFAGLRPYQPGDPLRRVHWPSSARCAEPMVVTRSAAGTESLVLQVAPHLTGTAREEAIRRVVGSAEVHFARGDAVGLSADNHELEPRPGPVARRALLTRLALLERR